MVKNLAASIRQKLLNKARAEEKPFNELLQYFAIERFLYRLSISRYVDKFILKGALLFRVWSEQDSRATRDIDFLAFTDNSATGLTAIVKEIAELKSDDGLLFDLSSIQSQRIKEDANYEGVCVLFDATLDGAKARLQLDIAFGDTVHPKPSKSVYPTLIDLPAPVLNLYPPETVFAEKLEAMLHLGVINSRMKDFYDIWRLRQQLFVGEVLLQAVTKTIDNRKTKVVSFAVLEKELNESNDKQKQWSAFLEKSKLSGPAGFDDLLEQIGIIISPVLDAVIAKSEFDAKWDAGGPWINLR